LITLREAIKYFQKNALSEISKARDDNSLGGGTVILLSSGAGALSPPKMLSETHFDSVASQRSATSSSPRNHLPALNAMSLCYGPSKSAIDQIVRSCGGLARSERIESSPSSTTSSRVPVRVYAVAPHVYRTDMARRVADEMGLTMEQFAGLANPIYPGIPGSF
jgi:NAD(P)-dependent dehydrogenase (short-subunit alcohol dehydrogenase family)